MNFAEILNGFISKYAEILNASMPKYAEILNWKSRARLTSEGKAMVTESVRRRVFALDIYLLPQILFDIAVEGGFLCPAEGLEGLTDGGFDGGGDGALGAVVFVIALAGEEGDEVLLDGAGLAAGDVVVHVGEAKGHADGFIGTVLGAVLVLHLGVPEIDNGYDGVLLRDIVLQYVAQAVFALGTALTLADSSFLRHFAEKVFSVHWGRGGLL